MLKKILNSVTEAVMLWVIVFLAFWPEISVVVLAMLLAAVLSFMGVL